MNLDHFGFSSPAYLVALIVVPLLLAFSGILRRRRARYKVAFTNFEILAGVVAKRGTRWRQYVPLAALTLALALSGAALARPHIQLLSSNRGATIILLADVSGSMQATDVYPARIYAAVIAMRDFLDVLPQNDKVGLVSFSDSVEVLNAPTTDHAAVASSLDVLSPQGGTALGVGVETAVKLLVASLALSGIHRTAGEQLPAAIVLESDGAQNRGSVTPLAAAEFAKAAGIRIYGVALGTAHGTIAEGSGLLKASFRVPPDPGVVALLARVSGGQAFDATNAASLDTIYRGLGTSIARRPELSEISPWFELAAAAFLAGAVASALAWGAALP